MCNKWDKRGQIAYMFANSLWIIYAIVVGAYEQIFIQTFFIYKAVEGYKKWNKQQKEWLKLAKEENNNGKEYIPEWFKQKREKYEKWKRLAR